MTIDVAAQIKLLEAAAVARVQVDRTELANQYFDEVHRIAKEVSATREGRQAVEGLLHHPIPAVRLSIAAITLAWDSSKGVAALKQLRELPPGNGLIEFTAEMTLNEYESGRLRFDWW